MGAVVTEPGTEVTGGSKTSYPVEIKRCQHIKTSGAQCGSPALKDKGFCYYHESNRTVAAPLYLDGERYMDGQIKIPPLEDAHAVQTVLRHVLLLMMEKRIERKDAGLLLYGLQIASGNLKQMQVEKPRPTQVVRDPEKVAETPIGKTPWATNEEGHEVEDEAVGFQGEIATRLKLEARVARERLESYQRDARRMAELVKNELKQEPKLDYDRLRWTLANFAGDVGNGLGHPRPLLEEWS